MFLFGTGNQISTALHLRAIDDLIRRLELTPLARRSLVLELLLGSLGTRLGGQGCAVSQQCSPAQR